MELLAKLEKRVAGWLKDVPHLPVAGQRWLAQNVWWIVIVGVVMSGISFLVKLTDLFGQIALLGTYASTYFVTANVTSWLITTSLVSLVFIALNLILLGVAINPLRAMAKKGWVLLFAAWLVNLLAVVVGAIISFSLVWTVMSLVFGVLFLAVAGYFLFEIHGQFAHPAKPAKKSR